MGVNCRQKGDAGQEEVAAEGKASAKVDVARRRERGTGVK
jgi:hypothetical protein